MLERSDLGSCFKQEAWEGQPIKRFDGCACNCPSSVDVADRGMALCYVLVLSKSTLGGLLQCSSTLIRRTAFIDPLVVVRLIYTASRCLTLSSTVLKL